MQFVNWFNSLDLKKLLIAALVMQMAFFAVSAYQSRGNWLYADNVLYETPAWNLASGHGLSFARSEWEDPYLTGLYHNRHPESVDDPYVPATVLPIGYSIFLSGVYFLFGRNQLAAVLANWVLLLIAVAGVFLLIKRTFGERLEARIALIIIASFPLFGFWASKMMSDTLHIALLVLFALFFFTREISLSKVILAGVFLGLAAVVRPYATLLPIALGVGGMVFRCAAFNWRNAAVLALICWSILGLWAGRNYYQFGKPMLTSMGPGYGLWIATYKDYFNVASDDAELYEKETALGIENHHQVEGNSCLLSVAVERIKERPFRFAIASATNIPRFWISMGGASASASKKILLGPRLGVLFIFWRIGIVLSRKTRDPVLGGSIVIVLYYALLFAPLNVEERYMLPARFFSFLLAAAALTFIVRRLFSLADEKQALTD